MTSGERWSIAVLGAIALMTFFFPLLSVHVPIAGDQTFTGYDAVSRIGSSTPFPSSQRGPFPPNAGPSSSLPWSIRWFALTPILIVVALVCALLTAIGALTTPALSRAASTIGALCCVAAIVHISIANSDMRAMLQRATADNPDL